MATSLSVTRSRLNELAARIEKLGIPSGTDVKQLAQTLGAEPTATAIVQQARLLGTTGFDALAKSGSVRLAAIDAVVLQLGELQKSRAGTMAWSANEAVFREANLEGGNQYARLKIPLTHVYEHNVREFDAKFGVKETLPKGERIKMAEVPQRFKALIESYDAVAAQSPVEVKKLKLTEQKAFGRTYEMVAYQVGASNPPPGKVGLVITAGVHGDEMGSAQGLAETFQKVLQRPDLLKKYEPIVVVPSVSPVSLDLGIREDSDGKDPNRKFWNEGSSISFSGKAAQKLLGETKKDAPFLFVDLHQDDRYAVDEGYALFNNAESRVLAEAGIRQLEAGGRRAVKTEIDGVENGGGSLRKGYPNTFTPDPTRSTKVTREVLLEINDPHGFWGAIEGVLTSPQVESLLG